ncbi:MAG: molybdate ABC transporter permease subunit [Pseudomonadota bacterium]
MFGLSPVDWSSISLSLQLAAITALLLMVLLLPLAWWISRRTNVWTQSTEAILTLPLVLPPTVLGFYLLIAFSQDHWFGQTWQAIFGDTLVFSFSGLVLASMLYSLPFVLRPLVSAFQWISPELIQTLQSLNISWWERKKILLLDMNRRALLAAFILGFAHTLGEFGVILMIGGNIPGETQVASMLMFEYVETLQMEKAHRLAWVLLLISITLLLLTYRLTANARYRH